MEEPFEAIVNSLRLIRGEAAKILTSAYRRRTLRRRLEFKAIVLRLVEIRAKAIIRIQSLVRGFLVQRATFPLKKWRRMILWRSPASSVRVVGNITEPPWSREIELKRVRKLDLFYTDYMYQQGLPFGKYSIKFIVDCKWVNSGALPVILDSSGNSNNIFNYRAIQHLPRSSCSVGALPALELLEHIKRPVNDETESLPPRSLNASMESSTSLYADQASQGDFTDELLPGVTIKGFMAAHPVCKTHPLSHEGSADAYFIDKDLKMFGVADGVGEWERHGLDPSLFSKELMKHCRSLANGMKAELLSAPSDRLCKLLKRIMSQAFRNTQAWGSSTAMICMISGNKLAVVNLGDSSVMLMRQSKFNRDKLYKLYRTTEQQHFFNCPYQLSHIPHPSDFPLLLQQGYDKLVSYFKKVYTSGCYQPSDSPEELALSAVVDLQDGDVIVAATDGLFDNLFDTDIKKTGERELKLLNTDSEFCKRLAQNLVVYAVEKAFDTRYISPFAKAAKKSKNHFVGGKLDDVTVIVARVSRLSG